MPEDGIGARGLAVSGEQARGNDQGIAPDIEVLDRQRVGRFGFVVDRQGIGRQLRGGQVEAAGRVAPQLVLVAGGRLEPIGDRGEGRAGLADGGLITRHQKERREGEVGGRRLDRQDLLVIGHGGVDVEPDKTFQPLGADQPADIRLLGRKFGLCLHLCRISGKGEQEGKGKSRWRSHVRRRQPPQNGLGSQKRVMTLRVTVATLLSKPLQGRAET